MEDEAKHGPPKSKTFQQKVRHVCKTSVERSCVRQIKKEMLALDDSKGIHLQQHTECLYSFMKLISEIYSQNFELSAF